MIRHGSACACKTHTPGVALESHLSPSPESLPSTRLPLALCSGSASSETLPRTTTSCRSTLLTHCYPYPPARHPQPPPRSHPSGMTVDPPWGPGGELSVMTRAGGALPRPHLCLPPLPFCAAFTRPAVFWGLSSGAGSDLQPGG